MAGLDDAIRAAEESKRASQARALEERRRRDWFAKLGGCEGTVVSPPNSHAELIEDFVTRVPAKLWRKSDTRYLVDGPYGTTVHRLDDYVSGPGRNSGRGSRNRRTKRQGRAVRFVYVMDFEYDSLDRSHYVVSVHIGDDGTVFAPKSGDLVWGSPSRFSRAAADFLVRHIG